MEINVLCQPGSSVAAISLAPHESITAEAGSMISIDGQVTIQTNTFKRNSGSLLKAAKRLFAGESFFLNHFTAGDQAAKIIFAPDLMGDITVIELEGLPVIAEAGSFLCLEPRIQMDVSWQGFRSFLSGEAPFWLKFTGQGKIVLSAFGSITKIPVNGSFIVDTGHIVAFQESLSFKLSKAGGSWFQSILGGEGIVCEFQGQGYVWVQSHSKNAFGYTLGPGLKPIKQ